MKISQDLQISLTVAMTEADRLRHEYAGLEHLLYALTLDQETAAVLRHSGISMETALPISLLGRVAMALVWCTSSSTSRLQPPLPI